MQNFVKAIFKCRKGVGWKGSVQKYWQRSIVKMYETIRSIEEGKLPKLVSAKRITLYERGKKRIIVPIVIDDRMIQRVICDESMLPMMERSLIYDNGASLKDKGVEFTRKRVMKHLTEAVKEYGTDFYILTYDMKSFFDSIPHAVCRDMLHKYYSDERIERLIMEIVQSYQEDKANSYTDSKERAQYLDDLKNNRKTGICLGSQISQVLALGVPNPLDHCIKDRCGVRHSIRYMDDGVIIAKTKEELQTLLDAVREQVRLLGMRINEKKTHIAKSSKGFVFLKIHYYVTKTGHIVRKMAKSSIIRMRRKLKKFKRLIADGKMTVQDVKNSIQSWMAHAARADTFHAVKNMLKRYNALYG